MAYDLRASVERLGGNLVPEISRRNGHGLLTEKMHRRRRF